MKKYTRIIIIAVLLNVCIAVGITLFFMNSKYNLRHFFDDWEKEVDGNFLSVTYRDVLLKDGKEHYLRDAYSGIREIFCIEGDRIYFVYSTNDSESNKTMWHIASCNLQLEDFVEHCSSEFFMEESEGVSWSGSYVILHNYYDLEAKVGGTYHDHRILLKDRQKMLVYDIRTGEATEYQDITEWQPVLRELFPRRYIWEIQDHQQIVFTDTETGETRTVNLDNMAAMNNYAKQIQSLESRKTWDGIPLLENFLANVEICNGEIYIICSVSCWDGNEIAVVFHYDFATEKIKFVTVQKVGAWVDHNYYLIEQVP